MAVSERVVLEEIIRLLEYAKSFASAAEELAKAIDENLAHEIYDAKGLIEYAVDEVHKHKEGRDCRE